MGELRSGDDFMPDSMAEQPDTGASDGERLISETLRRLQAIDDVPPPEPAFVRQIREELMHSTTISLPVTHTLTADENRNGHGGPLALLSRPKPTRIARPRSWLSSLATAALVVLTLIGSYFAFGRVLRPISQEEAPVLIPAVIGTPEGTPAAGIAVSAESLAEVSVPGGVLAQPTKGSNVWLFSHYAIEPGDHVTYSECTAPEFVVRYVLHGTYAVQPTGPLTVIRNAAAGANAVQEQVAAGENAELHAGDALVYHNGAGDLYAGFRNPGPDRLDLLEWQWIEDDCLDAIPVGLDLDWDIWTHWTAMTLDQVPFDPTRPFVLHMGRVTAAPGVELPQAGPDGPGLLPPGTPGLDAAAAETGKLVVENMPARLLATTYSPPGGWAGASAFLPAGTPRTIRNSGDEPLLLYTLTITNAEGSTMASATPAAATPMG